MSFRKMQGHREAGRRERAAHTWALPGPPPPGSPWARSVLSPSRAGDRRVTGPAPGAHGPAGGHEGNGQTRRCELTAPTAGCTVRQNRGGRLTPPRSSPTRLPGGVAAWRQVQGRRRDEGCRVTAAAGPRVWGQRRGPATGTAGPRRAGSGPWAPGWRRKGRLREPWVWGEEQGRGLGAEPEAPTLGPALSLCPVSLSPLRPQFLHLPAPPSQPPQQPRPRSPGGRMPVALLF